MTPDDTYDSGCSSAVVLQRAGRWDLALDALPDVDDAAVRRLRAEILADRCWWQVTGEDEAEAAADVVAADSEVMAGFIRAQLSYARLLFDRDVRPDDLARVEQGFAAPELAGWGAFWLGVTAENIHSDPAAAAVFYARAAQHTNGDLLLESYVVRHQGGQLVDSDPAAGIALLRRSLALRAAVGARPAFAGAAATMAQVLPDGDLEAVLWRRVALDAARELRLVGLLGQLSTEAVA
jgi:hypothetical protein